MADEMVLGACFWGPRQESAEQCARRWLAFLQRLASLKDGEGLLRGWLDLPAAPPKELAGERVEPLPLTLPELARLVGQGAPADREHGFGFGTSNGGQGGRRVDFDGTCGGYATAEGFLSNSVFLELGVETGADALRWARLAEDLLTALAEEWEPDWGYLGTRTLRDRQERSHREPVVGWVTYLSPGRCQRIPVELAGRVRGTREGGVVLSLIDQDGRLPEPQRVIQAARALRAAGALGPTPVDRARAGDPGVSKPDPPPGGDGATTPLRLALKYDPTPENAAAFAADTVAAARQVANVGLDYSPASLERVDEILARLREQGQPSQAIGETLFCFGCYVGEVMVRHTDGRWDVPRADREMDWAVGGYPLLVRFPSGGWANPIANAFETYEDPARSVAFFYQAMTSQLADKKTNGRVPDDR